MRTFVLGDSHGAYKAFLQCVERSGFDYEKDTLICLGDVVDGYPESRELIDELLKIKNLILIIGNHDKWFLEWATSTREHDWATQGGQATFNSYIPESHIELFKNAHAYHVDEKNRLFVHGGLDVNQPDITKQKIDVLMWDRRLVTLARKRDGRGGGKVYDFEEIFVGHTATTYSCGGTEPRKFCNLWMIDTGAGFEGKLTIMDIDTHEFWQSDLVHRLYPKSRQAERVRFQLLQDSAS